MVLPGLRAWFVVRCWINSPPPGKRGGCKDGHHHQQQSAHQAQTTRILAAHARRHNATKVREKSRTSRVKIAAVHSEAGNGASQALEDCPEGKSQ